MNDPICPLCYYKLMASDIQTDGDDRFCVCPGCGQTFIIENGELKVAEMAVEEREL